MQIGDDTPWGQIDNIEELAPGIWSVCTASHGGIVLDHQHADRIPATIEPFTHDPRYWEEDQDYMVPFLLFSDEIANGRSTDAHLNLTVTIHHVRELLEICKPQWAATIEAHLQAQKEKPEPLDWREGEPCTECGGRAIHHHKCKNIQKENKPCAE